MGCFSSAPVPEQQAGPAAPVKAPAPAPASAAPARTVVVNGAKTQESAKQPEAKPHAAKNELKGAQRYEISPGALGKGHFAVVKKCRDLITGATYAVKIIDKKELVKSSSSVVKQEIEILRAVGSHPNIVQLIDHFEDTTKHYLVMELCLGGDLFSQIVEHGKYSEQEAVRCCKQLASALQHMHACGVTHRDLKPENILLIEASPSSPLKLADFGLSKLIKGHLHPMRTVCGTWAYCAPEVIQRKPYDSAVDRWSLGVLSYILLSGYHPFDVFGDCPEPELLQRIISCTYDFNDEVWTPVSQEAKDLIRGLLVLDPSKRLTLDAYLASPWINQGKNASEMNNSLVVERLAKFSVGKRKFRAVTAMLIASNKFKNSLSRSRRNQNNSGKNGGTTVTMSIDGIPLLSNGEPDYLGLGSERGGPGSARSGSRFEGLESVREGKTGSSLFPTSARGHEPSSSGGSASGSHHQRAVLSVNNLDVATTGRSDRASSLDAEDETNSNSPFHPGPTIHTQDTDSPAIGGKRGELKGGGSFRENDSPGPEEMRTR